MAAHHDPKLLYSINNIKAYHIQNGEEQSLTPSGPQTLSLLMVPTDSPYADLSTTIPQGQAPDEDFYLHLNLPPELDLPMPATTQIYHQPPSSYLIPRWDLGAEQGAFTRLEFPAIGRGVSQEDVDTFETILAQCTSFLERAKPPLPRRKSDKTPYNPSDYAPGGRYAAGNIGDEKNTPGHLVLVDEENGSVVGELGEGAQVVEEAGVKHGSKRPVEIEMSPDGKRVVVRPINEEYLRMARHPAYKDSGMVQNAAAASRLIVTTGGYLSNLMTSGAENFTKKVTPNQKPMEFDPATHERVRKINTFTNSVASTSSKTIGQAGNLVQNWTAKMAGHKKERPHKGYDEKGNPLSAEDYKPGFLNRSMIAFSTIGDGVAESGRNLLQSGAAATGLVVGHKYGDEAGNIATQLAGGVKNVGLVYIDVTGVSRRAVIKSVAKGMVIGKVRGGGEVVVGGGDGGVLPEQELAQDGALRKEKSDYNPGPPSGGSVGPSFTPSSERYNPMGSGGAAPPQYQEFGKKQ